MTKLSWKKRCQRCGKIKESTRRRTMYSQDYVGPCGDSFCYASCTSTSCRSIEASVCNDCEQQITKGKQ